MIDIETYRTRIGVFTTKNRKSLFKNIQEYYDYSTSDSYNSGKNAFNATKTILKVILILTLLYPTCPDVPPYRPILSTTYTHLPGQCYSSSLVLPALVTSGKFSTTVTVGEQVLQWREYFVVSVKQTTNCRARSLHGNTKRGIVNLHINVRSLYRKMVEVKNLVQQEKPHLLGCSECELRKSHHNENSLKIPGYDLLLPKSWDVYGKARVVVYIKKSLEYEHLVGLEDENIQSIWVRAGFKNTKKIFYSHQYREHTSTLGSSMASQRAALDKMLVQWEEALTYDSSGSPNEVHVAGDMNLDSSGGRWLDPGYSLVSLGRMIDQCCSANNFYQMVDKITRVQYNSVRRETATSCIDHVYCNAKHRISTVRVVTFGASDHDAVVYTRFSKEPTPNI